MHEYSKERKDSLRISEDNFSSDSVKLCLKDIVKVKDRKRGFTITYDMFEEGKCPKVPVCFPCMIYTPVLPSSHYHLHLTCRGISLNGLAFYRRIAWLSKSMTQR